MTEEKTAAILFLVSLVSALTHWIAFIAGEEDSPCNATILFIVLMVVLASTTLGSLVVLLLSAFN